MFRAKPEWGIEQGCGLVDRLEGHLYPERGNVCLNRLEASSGFCSMIHTVHIILVATSPRGRTETPGPGQSLILNILWTVWWLDWRWHIKWWSSWCIVWLAGCWLDLFILNCCLSEHRTCNDVFVQRGRWVLTQSLNDAGTSELFVQGTCIGACCTLRNGRLEGAVWIQSTNFATLAMVNRRRTWVNYHFSLQMCTFGC